MKIQHLCASLMSCVIDRKDKQVPVHDACSQRVIVCLKGSMTAR